ncbi:MAG TPA: phosphatidylglycerol lysyltransferase domain-containing protein [Mycobacteriales bacterium]|nr:phosphatidylglycerol lysyltransferase domain-containing protein [Mycobacteriales bacterium]
MSAVAAQRGADTSEEPEGPRQRRAWDTSWVPRVAGIVAYVAGLLNLASAITPPERSRLTALRDVIPGAVSSVATAATVSAGVLLLLLAKGLRRRKRRAWRAAVALLAASVALHVIKGLDVEEAVVAFVCLVGLVVTRKEFRAVSDRSSRWTAVAALLGLLALDLIVGILLLETTDMVRGNTGTWAYFETVLRGLVGLNGPIHAVSHRRDDSIGDTLVALGALTAVVTAYLALRPSEPRPHLSHDDEERMRALLAKQGRRDSLGYFALRRDKSVIWSPTGKACIAYRVLSGVMLASGDPLGDPEAWPGAINAFLDEADRHAWTPAVMACSEQGGEAWARAGLDALELGDEAIIDVEDFSLEGRAMRNVRQAVARVERAGYSCEVTRIGALGEQRKRELRAQAAAWRGAETERGFSMALGRFGDPEDGRCVGVLAMQEGRMRAFLHFVPWGDDGLSLDLMRRDRDAENGLNELLIVSALQAAPSLGVTRVSLNFAVFRSALERGERIGAGFVLRGWRGLLLFASRWFQIESLYKFNAKFRPVWEPRFVCYPSASHLPRIAIAALEAEAFLVLPSLSRTRRPGS